MISFKKEEISFTIGVICYFEKDVYNFGGGKLIYFRGIAILLGYYVLRVGSFSDVNNEIL